MSDNFQAFMVESLATQIDIAGKAVLELGADPALGSAKAFRLHGAASIVSSDIADVWSGGHVPGVVTALIDARAIEKVLPPRSVDIVYGINLLEHLADIPQALESIAKVLRPGGIALLHGHPIWTSARGHHMLLGDPPDWRAHFGEASDPIPPWGHLTLTPDQMAAELADRPEDVREGALHWCYGCDLITRTPRRKILEAAHAGPLKIRHTWEDSIDTPSDEVLDRIRNSPWWDEAEDYSVRSVALVMEP